MLLKLNNTIGKGYLSTDIVDASLYMLNDEIQSSYASPKDYVILNSTHFNFFVHQRTNNTLSDNSYTFKLISILSSNIKTIYIPLFHASHCSLAIIELKSEKEINIQYIDSLPSYKNDQFWIDFLKTYFIYLFNFKGLNPKINTQIIIPKNLQNDCNNCGIFIIQYTIEKLLQLTIGNINFDPNLTRLNIVNKIIDKYDKDLDKKNFK